jgi:effector-binding domain-containing protein
MQRSTHGGSLALAAATVLGLLGACQSVGGAPRHAASGPGPEVLPDLSVAHAPFHQVEVNWKQRLAQPYVYLEARGSYTNFGALLEELHGRLKGLALTPTGPPFALYYDDPGRVPVDQLRMRACFPVSGSARPAPPLARDLLESTTVVYAFVGGAYPEVPRAYPELYAFMSELGWVENGPVREVYLVNPATVDSYEALVTEIQIPATSNR